MFKIIILINMENSKPLFECYICLDVPKSPVATSCGHIFCWKCIQSWVNGKSLLTCPVCKNGIDLNKVIPLYTNSEDSQERDNRPKVERINPVVNQNAPSFVIYENNS